MTNPMTLGRVIEKLDHLINRKNYVINQREKDGRPTGIEKSERQSLVIARNIVNDFKNGKISYTS